MKQFVTIVLLSFLVNFGAFGQTGTPITLHTGSGNIEGTLLIPETKGTVPVAVLIAGSGPTDRDGNNPMMKNNALKMLATALYHHGIASLRYDKRGIAASQPAGTDESKLRFNQYIEDAVGWSRLLKQNKKFNKILIIGHSEGSLIGMVAAQQPWVDKFISLAGAGQPADRLIRKQLSTQPAFILQQCTPILNELVKGNTVDSIPPYLNALFRKSVQPYLISWFKYNPQTEIKKLKKPVLIVQGTTDIQVSINDAEKLKEANPQARLAVIKGMNHILKDAPADRQENIKTYSQPDLPLNNELVQIVVDFIKK